MAGCLTHLVMSALLKLLMENAVLFLSTHRFQKCIVGLVFCFGMTLSAGEVWSEYVGDFRIDQSTVLSIRLEGVQLVGEIPQRPRFQLREIHKDTFQVQNVPVKLVFLRNQQGGITRVEIRQPLSDTIALRLNADSEQSTQKPALQLEEDHLQRLVGRYVTGGLVVVLIRFENSQLTYQPLGPKKYVLVPISDKVFQVEGKTTRVEFQLDETGPAPSIIVSEGQTRRKMIRTPQ